MPLMPPLRKRQTPYAVRVVRIKIYLILNPQDGEEDGVPRYIMGVRLAWCRSRGLADFIVAILAATTARS